MKVKEFAAKIAEAFSDEELSQLVEFWDGDIYEELYHEVNVINARRNPHEYAGEDIPMSVG